MRRLLALALSVSLLTGCAAAPGDEVAPDIDVANPEQEPAPAPAEPEYAGVDTTISAADTSFGDELSDACSVTVRVPEGWVVEGPIIRLGGDPIAGSFFLRGSATNGATIDDVPGWMLDFVEWESRDGGQFLTVAGQEAWRVTGYLTDANHGPRWSMLGDIIDGPCDLSISASTTPDDAATRELLLAMFETVRLRS